MITGIYKVNRFGISAPMQVSGCFNSAYWIGGDYLWAAGGLDPQTYPVPLIDLDAHNCSDTYSNTTGKVTPLSTTCTFVIRY